MARFYKTTSYYGYGDEESIEIHSLKLTLLRTPIESSDPMELQYNVRFSPNYTTCQM